MGMHILPWIEIHGYDQPSPCNENQNRAINGFLYEIQGYIQTLRFEFFLVSWRLPIVAVGRNPWNESNPRKRDSFIFSVA